MEVQGILELAQIRTDTAEPCVDVYIDIDIDIDLDIDLDIATAVDTDVDIRLLYVSRGLFSYILFMCLLISLSV